MKKNDNIILTIVTVCYNSEKTISTCIDSILPQLNSEVEYLIIDGKSKDKTMDIVNKKTNGNKYVRVISEKDNGLYDAMNKGIDNAKGKYILYINSDDSLLKDSIKGVIDLLKEEKYDVIYGNVYYKMIIKNHTYLSLHKYESKLDDMKKFMIVHHQASFCKREALLEVKKFNIKYKVCSDYDIFLKLYNHNCSFYHIDNIIAYFSTGGVSSINASVKERWGIRKDNNANKWYIIRDMKNITLTKIKRLFVKCGIDVDCYLIKKRGYKLIK